MPEIEGEGIGRSPLVTALDKPPHGAKSMAPSWGDPSQNLTHALCTNLVTVLFQPFALMAPGRRSAGGWWRAAVVEVELDEFYLPGGRGLLVGYHVRLGRSSALETQRMLVNFLVFLGVLCLLLVPHCLWETSGAIS